jgi:glycosyltransferase involved in cell wall biosynthesis
LLGALNANGHRAVRTLYITYDGLLEPLGQSQVWSYVRRLSREHSMFLLSFEKTEHIHQAERMDAMRTECRDAGVVWIPLRYHKRPTVPATAYDIAAGILVGLVLTTRYKIQIVHARSYVAAVIALALKRMTRARFVFDMRGFWADERVDGGLWPAQGALYRTAKKLECRFLCSADAVVSLTRAAVNAMRQFPCIAGRPVRFEVIPTCADMHLFCPGTPRPDRDGFILGYVGSVGVWYLFNEVLAVFKVLKKMRPDARLLVVNRGGHDSIREAAGRAGIADADLELVEADHRKMPALIQRMDASAFFYKTSFSTAATAPTKLAELLAVGIPVMTNSGVGDSAEVVINGGLPVGVVVSDFSTSHIEQSVRDLLALCRETDINSRCRAVALRHFSADWGSGRYSNLYRAVSWPGQATNDGSGQN